MTHRFYDAKNNLQAIADILGCSVKDLLSSPTILQEEKNSQSLEDFLQENPASPSLMADCVNVIEKHLQKTQKTLTPDQFSTCVKEIYIHSFQKDPQKINGDFAEWFIDLIGIKPVNVVSQDKVPCWKARFWARFNLKRHIFSLTIKS